MFLSAILLPTLFILSVTLPAQERDVAAHFWNQDRGSASADGAVDVEPVRAAPNELWRSDLGELRSAPVVWSDRVFVLARSGRQVNLLVLSAEDGAQVTKARVGGPDMRGEVAVWQHLVAVVFEDELLRYHLKDDRLIRRKKVALGSPSPPCIDGPVLYLDTARGLGVVDLEAMEIIADVPGGSGRPACSDSWVAQADCGGRAGFLGSYLQLHFSPKARQREGGEWSAVYCEALFGGYLVAPTEPQSFLAFPLLDTASGSNTVYSPEVWYVRGTMALKTAKEESLPAQFLGNRTSNWLSPIQFDPVIHDGRLIGFNGAGELMEQIPNGGYRPANDEDNLPEGIRVGPLSRAGDVAYGPNFALDLAARRFLWILPELENTGPMIPLADRRLLVVAQDGSLVAMGVPAKGPVAVAVEAAAHLPSLEDLRALATGDSQPTENVENRVYLGWRAILAEEYAVLLREILESYRGSSLVDECLRLLAEAEERGVDAERLAAWRSLVSNRIQTRASNAEGRRAKLKEAEKERLLEFAVRHREAASWCAELQLRSAATLLRAEGLAFDPDLGAALPPREWIPAAFPDREAEDAPLRWRRWAEELLPAGAVFLTADHPALGRPRGSAWEQGAYALGTRNLLLLTRDQDPERIGACLRNGEGAVQVLEELFPPAAGAPEGRPMEVRIHTDRSTYLSEGAANGGPPPTWSVGYYSSRERTSRFYVPQEGDPAVDARELHKVLAHELTHQYLEERKDWHQGARMDTPGYWVVEGIARFLEDQAVELGRGRSGLDDATVLSVDTCARLLERDGLIPLAPMLRASQLNFLGLRDDVAIEITPRFTLCRRWMDLRGIYYDQAGALCFFLLNRCGETGRQGLLTYLQGFYEGRIDEESGRLFGFDSVADLEQAFLAFLSEVG